MEQTKYIVSSSPHCKAKDTTRSIMINVLIALVPTLIAGVIIFGLYSLIIVILAMLASVAGEFLFNVITKQKQSIRDMSACVTGVILGLSLPPATPFYVPIVGGLFATMIVKMLFGGIGKNFANPAATARIFLLLCWGAQMTKAWLLPNAYLGNFFNGFQGILGVDGLDSITGATPLSGGAFHGLSLFLGNVGGSIGEVSAVAILIGGIYLVIRRIIDWKIPVVVIGSFAFFTLCFTGSFASVLPQLLSGGILFVAVFMATDYATMPKNKWGVMIYAFCIGFLAVLLRQLTNMPEGISYALVLCNLITPLLDKYIVPVFFGSARKPILKYSVLSTFAAVLLGLVVGFSTSFGMEATRAAEFYGQPGSYIAAVYQDEQEDASVHAAFVASDGAFIFDVIGKKGYANGTVNMWISMKDGKIVGASVYANSQNLSGIGFKDTIVFEQQIAKYIGKSVQSKGFILKTDIDAYSGATMTSTAMNNAFNAAMAGYQTLTGVAK